MIKLLAERAARRNFRITIRRNGQVLPTQHIILTFNTKAAYLSCPVRPYIPNPRRCFNCQHYGYSMTTCRGSFTYARCAKSGHDNKPFEKAERYANCKGDHAAYSSYSPKRFREKEILSVAITQKLCYPEVWKLFESRIPSASVSYSSLLKPSSKSVRHMGIQSQCSLIADTSAALASDTFKEQFRDMSCYCKTGNLARSKLLLHSSHPTTIEYFDPSKSLYIILIITASHNELT